MGIITSNSNTNSIKDWLAANKQLVFTAFENHMLKTDNIFSKEKVNLAPANEITFITDHHLKMIRDLLCFMIPTSVQEMKYILNVLKQAPSIECVDKNTPNTTYLRNRFKKLVLTFHPDKQPKKCDIANNMYVTLLSNGLNCREKYKEHLRILCYISRHCPIYYSMLIKHYAAFIKDIISDVQVKTAYPIICMTMVTRRASERTIDNLISQGVDDLLPKIISYAYDMSESLAYKLMINARVHVEKMDDDRVVNQQTKAMQLK